MYENYRLANSTQTNAYVGSTLPEMMKVSEVLQQRYDASVEGMDAGNELIRNAKALPKDQALLKQRADEYSGFLKSTASRPDLENVTQDVFRRAKRFAGEYKNFAANQQAAAAYEEEIDKGVTEGKWSKTRADQAKAISHATYSGLKYDPNTGKYEGAFRGIEAAPEVDKLEWVKKAVGDVAASSNATVVERPDGLYFRTREGSEERVDWNKIKPALDAAYALDGKLQADINQSAQFEGFGYSRFKIADLEANKETAGIAAKAKELMAADKSLTEGQALARVGEENLKRNSKQNLESLASKYIYKKTKTSDTIGGLTYDAQERLAKAAIPPDVPPLIVPDADTTFSEKERDATKITESVKQADASLEVINGKLANTANLSPDDVAELRRQKANLENTRYTHQHLLDAAGDDVVKTMINPKTGRYYTGLTEFNAANKGTVEDNPVPGQMFRGRKVKAVLPNPMYGGTTIRYENGDESFLSKKENNPQVNTFNKLRADAIKDHAEKYAVKPSVVSLKPNTAKAMHTILSGSPAAAEWYEVGGKEPLASDDIPKNFAVTGMQIVKNGGSTYLKVQELSSEKGTVGQPTGKTYNLRVGPGNNLGVVAGKDLLYSNGKMNADRDAQAAASVLMGGNWSGALMSLGNNEKIPVTSSKGNTVGYVERKQYSTAPGKSRFLVFDSKGNDISTKISENFRSDPTALAGWIEKVLAEEEKD